MQQTANNQHDVRSRRRLFIAFLASLLVSALLVTVTDAPASSQLQRLKDVTPPGLTVGAVLHSYDPAWDDGDYVQVAGEEFNAITATAYMPWGPWPDPNGPIDTTPLGDVIAWAQDPAHPMPVHAHGLVYPWANDQLAWWNALPLGSGEHERLLEQYVTTVASAHAGDIWVWDVVNEVFADYGDSRRDADGLRNDYLEYTQIGSDYVEKAFRWAEAADPNALLIINDYGAEEINQKSDNLLAYAIKLRDRGVKIDGVGFQAHIQGHIDEPDYLSIRRNFDRFAAAGFKIFITEFDVMATDAASAADVPTAAELARQKSIYNEITRIAVEQPAVESLLMWDFADNRSWLQPTPSQLGQVGPGRYTFPTPWSGGAVGESLTKKPAYDGMFEALQAGPNAPTFATGAHRFNSEWEPASSYLTRSGDLFPGDGIDLTIEGVRGDQWTIEPAGNGFHRIRNTWGSADGYLTRQGTLNDDGGYTPNRNLDLHPLNVDWSSQLWRFEPIGNGRYRIRNAWAPSSGVLTRDGLPNGNDGYDAAPAASLNQRNDDWTSQWWSATAVSGPGFACQVDAGNVSWSDDGAPKYWIYKSTDGGASYDWLGRTTGNPAPTSFSDPNPTVGATYQVHYQGLPRVDCTTTSEPPDEPSFACASDAGLLTWTDDGAPKYWIYKSTDGGASYDWLGRTTGNPAPTSFTDASPAMSTRYQVHYQGLPRVDCAITNEPTGGGNAFTCEASGAELTWTDRDVDKYWVYRSVDGGATYNWLGRTAGSPAPTTFTDNNPVANATYQVHYAGIPRTDCTS